MLFACESTISTMISTAAWKRPGTPEVALRAAHQNSSTAASPSNADQTIESESLRVVKGQDLTPSPSKVFLWNGTSYVTVNDSMVPYKTTGHRHRPEIEQELALAGSEVAVTFVPTLVPVDQGELVASYVLLNEELPAHEILERYRDAYAMEPFVEVVDGPPSTKGVRETNFATIHVQVEEHTGRVMIFTAIDNLWKGTASQAVQSLNAMYGLPETTGLLPGSYPAGLATA